MCSIYSISIEENRWPQKKIKINFFLYNRFHFFFLACNIEVGTDWTAIFGIEQQQQKTRFIVLNGEGFFFFFLLEDAKWFFYSITSSFLRVCVIYWFIFSVCVLFFSIIFQNQRRLSCVTYEFDAACWKHRATRGGRAMNFICSYISRMQLKKNNRF